MNYTGQGHKIEVDLRWRRRTVSVWVAGWVRGVMFEGRRKHPSSVHTVFEMSGDEMEIIQ